MQFRPVERNYVLKVQASLAEVRELGGFRLIAEKPAAATAPAQATSSAQPVVSLSNKQVQCTVSLAPELAKQAGTECTCLFLPAALTVRFNQPHAVP